MPKRRTKPRGRIPKLTASVEKKIVSAIRKGSFLKGAAAASGIGYRTLLAWLAEGREEKGRAAFRHFQQQIELALMEALGEAEQAVFSADKRFWLTHGRHRKNWHPFRAEVDLVGRLEVENTTPESFEPPLEHLASAYKILMDMGLFPTNPEEVRAAYSRRRDERPRRDSDTGATVPTAAPAVQPSSSPTPTREAKRRPATLRRQSKA